MTSRASRSQSLRIKIVDLHVVYMHAIDDLWNVSYTWKHDHHPDRLFIGSALFPNSMIKNTKMKVGDEYTVLWQKTKSLYDEHIKRVKEP